MPDANPFDGLPGTRDYQGSSGQNPFDGLPGTSHAAPIPYTPRAQPQESPNYGMKALETAAAFGAAIPQGFLDLPEAGVNLASGMYERTPEWARGVMNYAFGGIPGVAHDLTGGEPINIGGALGNMLGAPELSKKHPIASAAGGIAGGMALPFPHMPGGNISNRLLRGFVQGAEAGGMAGGVSEAGRQVKAREDTDPLAIARQAMEGVGIGGGLGGAISPFLSRRITDPRRLIEQKLTPPGPTEQAQRYAMEGRHGFPENEPPTDEYGRVITPMSRRIEQRLTPPGTTERTGERATEAEQRLRPVYEPQGPYGYLSPQVSEHPPVFNPEEQPPGAWQLTDRSGSRATPPPPQSRSQIRITTGAPGDPAAKVNISNTVDREPLQGRVEKGGTKGGGIDKQPPTEPPDYINLDDDSEFTDVMDSWRDWRTANARPASPDELAKFSKLARLKVAFDKHDARLRSAGEELAKILNAQLPSRKSVTPEQWQELLKIIRQQGLIAERGELFVESALQTRIGTQYKFKSPTLRGKLDELKQLNAAANKAWGKYDQVRKALKGSLVYGDTVAIPVGKHVVNVSGKARTTYPIEPNGPNTRAQKQPYIDKDKELKNNGGAVEVEADPASLAKAINANPALKAELQSYGLMDYIDEIARATAKASRRTVHASALGPFQIFLDAADQAIKVSRARGYNPVTSAAKLVARTIHTLRASGFKGELTPRLIQRLTLNQLTSDAIRQYAPDFGYKRDAYLAAREKATIGGGETIGATEREAVTKMTPAEIRTSPLLKGWTSAQREMEAKSKELDDAYKALLKGEIKRVDAITGDAKYNSPAALSGYARYRRMLEHDWRDITGAGSDELSPLSGIFGRAVNGEYASIFLGNWRVGELHFGEAAVANLSKSPYRTLNAAKGLMTDPVYFEYAKMLSGKGMQQKIVEADKLALGRWLDAHVNSKIRAGVESLPHGKLLRMIASAELPERLKGGLTAVAAAERVAHDLKYPGGAKQFMIDYMATAKGGTVPPARADKMLQAEIEVFRDRNRSIMAMPEGPIQERTVFQRHAPLKPIFPMLRNVVQQARVITSYADDLAEAIAKKDSKAAAKAVGSLIFAHILIATIAGKYTLPEYVWDSLDHLNKREADLLRKSFETLRAHNALGGRRAKEFGNAYVPAMRGGNIFALGIAREAASLVDGENYTQKKDPDHRRLMRGVIVSMAALGADNIGQMEGTQNMLYLGQRLYDGMKGTERVRFYEELTLPQVLQGKRARKLYDKVHKTNVLQGFLDWALVGESAGKVKLHAKAEHEQKRRDAVRKGVSEALPDNISSPSPKLPSTLDETSPRYLTPLQQRRWDERMRKRELQRIKVQSHPLA